MGAGRTSAAALMTTIAIAAAAAPVAMAGPPANDAIAHAHVITGFGLLTAATVTATAVASEPTVMADPAYGGGGHSIWYRYKATSPAQFSVGTIGSAYPASMWVFKGTPTANSPVHAFSLGSFRVSFNPTPGTTYYIAVDGENGATGKVKLTWGDPSNDFFAAASAFVNVTSYAGGGTTVGATKEPDEPNHAGNSGGRSVWYAIQAPKSGILTIDTATSRFDTLLAVYTSVRPNVFWLTPVAANDDVGATLQSKVTLPVVAGTYYYVAIDGYSGASGTYRWHWSIV
jgi:hypothetical protein